MVYIHIRYFEREAEISTALLEAQRPVTPNVIGFATNGRDAYNRVLISEDPIGFEGGDVNLFRYVGNNPVNWIDPIGLAQIGNRPLDSRWIPFNGSGRFHHDQIWYTDATNSGFFDDDSIRPDINYTRADYTFARDPNHYDDNLMREVERNVQRTWDMDWRLRNNNCQDYVDAVRREYERLRRARELKKCH